MTVLMDILITAISLVFLAILGAITGAAIPGLFMAAATPILELIMPTKEK